MAEFVKASMKGWPGYLTLPISRRPLDASNWSAGLIFPVQGASVGSRHTRTESGPKWRGLRVGVDASGRAAAQRHFAGRQWRRVQAGSGRPVQVVSIAAPRARWAVAKMALYGHPDAMANLIRRTLMVTRDR